MTYYTGIDIGSTATKVVVLSDGAVADRFTLPTGWSSKETAGEVSRRLAVSGYPVTGGDRGLATRSGRVSVG